MPHPIVDSLFLFPVTSLECNNIIKNLKNTKQNINSISMTIIKENSVKLSEIFCHIINLCFSQGKFPKIFKEAIVIPIFKKGERIELPNYRPISLLLIFCKILEKCIHSRVMDFIVEKRVLSPKQFGFQKGLSTELAINSLLYNIIDSLENKEIGFCILLDFAKAFDTVNHEILLAKLEYYGIRGIAYNWFKSYLSNRKQCTEIGNFQSKFDYVKHGVPQGSVLGPLSFLLYINDMIFSSSICKFTLFADDTSLFYSHKNKAEGAKILNDELTKIAEWLAANKLSLNVGKSKLLIFSNQRSKVNDEQTTSSADSDPSDNQAEIYINGEKLKEVDHAKYLGTLIDNKLNWSIT